MGAAGTGSSGEMHHKKAPTAVRSGGVPSPRRGTGAARSDSNREILPKKASGGVSVSVPTTHPGKVPMDTGSTGEMPPMRTMASSGGSPSQTRVGKAKTGLRTETPWKSNRAEEKMKLEPGVPSRIGPRAPGIKGVGTSTALPAAGEHKPTKSKRADMANSGTMLLKPSTKVKSVGSGGQTVHKCRAKESGSHASMDNHNARTAAAKDYEEPVANYRTMKGKARTASSAKMSQKLCSKDKADTGLSGGMLLQKQSSKVAADMGLSGEMLHENPATKEALDVQEQEARLLIQELDELHMGESISFKEFNSYIEQLAPNPPWIDRNVKLEDDELLHQQDCLHGLYRFRYYKDKLSQQVSKKELHGDKLKEDYPEEDGSTWKEEFLQDSCEEDCSLEFLEKYGFFERFEKDGSLDWFFHPDYIYCASLDDYQHLVLLNYGGYEYARWRDYHHYLHTYKIEREYLKYYEKLSKDLKWIENYRHTDQSSHKQRSLPSN